MADVVYVTITVAFFAIAVGLVRACDALIGSDPEDLDEPVDTVDDVAVEVPEGAAA